MSSKVKVILIWILILVAAVAIYSFIERSPQSTLVLSLDELFSQVQRGGVAEVRVEGSDLQGRLSNGERFQATIPDGYPAIFERLTQGGVRVTILPVKSSWFSIAWPSPTTLLVTGLILWIAISTVILMLVVDLSRLVKRHLAQSNSNPSAA